MSIKRYSESGQAYDYEGMQPDSEGDWVKYADHEAEVVRLTAALGVSETMLANEKVQNSSLHKQLSEVLTENAKPGGPLWARGGRGVRLWRVSGTFCFVFAVLTSIFSGFGDWPAGMERMMWHQLAFAAVCFLADKKEAKP